MSEQELPPGIFLVKTDPGVNKTIRIPMKKNLTGKAVLEPRVVTADVVELTMYSTKTNKVVARWHETREKSE